MYYVWWESKQNLLWMALIKALERCAIPKAFFQASWNGNSKIQVPKTNAITETFLHQLFIGQCSPGHSTKSEPSIQQIEGSTKKPSRSHKSTATLSSKYFHSPRQLWHHSQYSLPPYQFLWVERSSLGGKGRSQDRVLLHAWFPRKMVRFTLAHALNHLFSKWREVLHCCSFWGVEQHPLVVHILKAMFITTDLHSQRISRLGMSLE